MRIGIDARMLGSNHGGIGRYVLELIKHLITIDKANEYIIFVNEADQVELLPFIGAAQNFKPVPANIRHYSLGEQLSFHRLLNKHALDLVHFPNFNVPLFYKGKFVVTIHDMVHHKISGAKKSHFFHFLAYKKIIQNAADKSAKIITVSEYSKQDIAKYLQVSLEKIKVIYEGVNLPSNVSEQQVAEVKRKFLLERPYFLFVGVLERKKNVVNLTRGFDAFIKKYGLDMDLVVAGKIDKHYPEIKHHALDIKASNRLVFTGYVEDADLAALYKGAYAYVSASLHEGFGLPGAEAMKFGLPLAVSNISVFNEVYDNAAIYFNPLNADDIAEKLHLLAKDKSFAGQLSMHSQTRVQLFDWNKTAQETLEIYKSCLNA